MRWTSLAGLLWLTASVGHAQSSVDAALQTADDVDGYTRKKRAKTYVPSVPASCRALQTTLKMAPSTPASAASPSGTSVRRRRMAW